MGIQTQLLGTNNDLEIVTAYGAVDISEDGKMAFLTISNNSPVPISGQKTRIKKVTLNIKSNNENGVKILDLEPSTWELESISNVKDLEKNYLQVIVRNGKDHLGLSPNENLHLTLLNIGKNGKFQEDDFLVDKGEQEAFYQLTVTFSNNMDSDETVSLEGFFFIVPNATTTPPPNVTTTPPPCATESNKLKPNEVSYSFNIRLFGLANIAISNCFALHFPLHFPPLNKLCPEWLKGVRKSMVTKK